MKLVTDPRNTPEDWPYESDPRRPEYTGPGCEECRQKTDRYVAMHSHADNEYGPVYYCRPCIKKALAAFDDN